MAPARAARAPVFGVTAQEFENETLGKPVRIFLSFSNLKRKIDAQESRSLILQIIGYRRAQIALKIKLLAHRRLRHVDSDSLATPLLDGTSLPQ